MATYEVYLGGNRKQNDGFAMFPSATFAADSTVQPAVRQRPIMVFPARDLDFGNETALIEYQKRVHCYVHSHAHSGLLGVFTLYAPPHYPRTDRHHAWR